MSVMVIKALWIFALGKCWTFDSWCNNFPRKEMHTYQRQQKWERDDPKNKQQQIIRSKIILL